MSTLTEREFEILCLLQLPNKVIAKRLWITNNTVKVHVKNIFRKTGMHRRMELVLFYKDQILAENNKGAGI